MALPPSPSPNEKKMAGGRDLRCTNLFDLLPAKTALLSLCLAMLATPAVHLVLVLFGAPLLSGVNETLLCAAHLAVLALYPVLYVRGVDSSAWLAISSFSAPLDEVTGSLVGAVVGGWLGAVPIPLDWDREWQKWPVTIVVGMYVGVTVGRLIGMTRQGRSTPS